MDNLQQLPDDLNCFKVTSKEDADCVGFFGGLNPLSNFHLAPFTVDGIVYISSEQFIQTKKAEFFSDRATYDKIMGSSTSLDCKKTSRFIKRFDKSKWTEVAKQVCSPGIKAKFHQNPDLMCTLLYKTGHKNIAECTNDKLWGTGIPLNKMECLDQSVWMGQGILGEILEEIREESRHFSFVHPPPGFDYGHVCLNNTTPFISVADTSQMPQNTAVLSTPCMVPPNASTIKLGCITSTATVPQQSTNVTLSTGIESTYLVKLPLNNPEDNLENLNLVANSTAKTNFNNQESEKATTSDTEPAVQNEVEMTELSPP